MKFSYEIAPRPIRSGGGWILHLFQDGIEVGGGIFPPFTADFDDESQALQAAHDRAEQEACKWIASKTK